MTKLDENEMKTLNASDDYSYHYINENEVSYVCMSRSETP